MIADGDKVQVGAPFVSGAKVVAKVVEHGRGEKIRIKCAAANTTKNVKVTAKTTHASKSCLLANLNKSRSI